MISLSLNQHDDIVAVLNKVSNVNDSGVELFIPEGSVLFKNPLSLKILIKESEKLGKVLHFNKKIMRLYQILIL
jgi:hypothetical protein